MGTDVPHCMIVLMSYEANIIVVVERGFSAVELAMNGSLIVNVVLTPEIVWVVKDETETLVGTAITTRLSGYVETEVVAHLEQAVFTVWSEPLAYMAAH